MIRVIDGKRYNTKTAEHLVDHESNAPRGDFRWYREALYQTKKGNYFLAGEGYASSKYAEPSGNMMGAGEGIIPLTKTEAFKWCERNAQDKVDIYFEDMITDA